MNKTELKQTLREVGMALQKTCIRTCRNTRALWLRIRLGAGHKDVEETAFAIFRMVNEGIWLLCWALCLMLLPCGLFKPACFVGSIAFAVLAAIFRTINIESKGLCSK